jgi:hypothetical protein
MTAVNEAVIRAAGGHRWHKARRRDGVRMAGREDVRVFGCAGQRWQTAKVGSENRVPKCRIQLPNWELTFEAESQE